MTINELTPLFIGFAFIKQTPIQLSLSHAKISMTKNFKCVITK
jgi:hypothetical protein